MLRCAIQVKITQDRRIRIAGRTWEDVSQPPRGRIDCPSSWGIGDANTTGARPVTTTNIVLNVVRFISKSHKAQSADLSLQKHGSAIPLEPPWKSASNREGRAFTVRRIGSIPTAILWRGWAGAHHGLISRECQCSTPGPATLLRCIIQKQTRHVMAIVLGTHLPFIWAASPVRNRGSLLEMCCPRSDLCMAQMCIQDTRPSREMCCPKRTHADVLSKLIPSQRCVSKTNARRRDVLSKPGWSSRDVLSN